MIRIQHILQLAAGGVHQEMALITRGAESAGKSRANKITTRRHAAQFHERKLLHHILHLPMVDTCRRELQKEAQVSKSKCCAELDEANDGPELHIASRACQPPNNNQRVKPCHQDSLGVSYRERDTCCDHTCSITCPRNCFPCALKQLPCPQSWLQSAQNYDNMLNLRKHNNTIVHWGRY